MIVLEKGTSNFLVASSICELATIANLPKDSVSVTTTNKIHFVNIHNPDELNLSGWYYQFEVETTDPKSNVAMFVPLRAVEEGITCHAIQEIVLDANNNVIGRLSDGSYLPSTHSILFNGFELLPGSLENKAPPSVLEGELIMYTEGSSSLEALERAIEVMTSFLYGFGVDFSRTTYEVTPLIRQLT